MSNFSFGLFHACSRAEFHHRRSLVIVSLSSEPLSHLHVEPREWEWERGTRVTKFHSVYVAVQLKPQNTCLDSGPTARHVFIEGCLNILLIYFLNRLGAPRTYY